MAYLLTVLFQTFEFFVLLLPYILAVFLFYGTCEYLITFARDMQLSLGVLQEETERYNQIVGTMTLKSRLNMKQMLFGLIEFQGSLLELGEFLFFMSFL